MAQVRTIRKYANRRLYDSEASRHVTLADLRQLVASGERINVIDDKSGEDLTRSVLLQIVADQEQFGSPVQSMLTRYLEQGFHTLLRQQDAMRTEMNKVLGAPLLGPFVDLACTNMEAFARMQATFFGAASAPAAQGGAGHAGGAEVAHDEQAAAPAKPDSNAEESK
ncbi:MAG TPA: polyhydroxyalkanoate synthesis regulator DNA-binding domain-containing protein [Steroidobacteraceae bacterium]|nr:polyhydroxyalkanoate synthesis regulator DNA-binding domain-containing protein [Steroidobacteraceae bacterium]